MRLAAALGRARGRQRRLRLQALALLARDMLRSGLRPCSVSRTVHHGTSRLPFIACPIGCCSQHGH